MRCLLFMSLLSLCLAFLEDDDYIIDPTLEVRNGPHNISVSVQPAAFGADIEMPGLVGQLVVYPLINSLKSDGCPIKTSPSLNNGNDKFPEGVPWIAVISRGDCTFVQKAVEAAKNNASAIIIYDYNRVPETEAPVMCGSPDNDFGANVSIPVVAITYPQYLTIANFVKSKSSTSMAHLGKFVHESNLRCRPHDDFGDDDNPFHWRKGFDDSMLPVLLVGAILTLGLGGALAALHYYVYLRRRRAILASVGQLSTALVLPGQQASVEAVNELPTKLYQPPAPDQQALEEGPEEQTAGIAEDSSSGSGTSGCGGKCSDGDGAGQAAAAPQAHETHEESHCSICLDDFEVGQTQRILPCGHVFHAPCVDEWLVSSLTQKNKSECPLCKQDPLPQRTSRILGGGADAAAATAASMATPWRVVADTWVGVIVGITGATRRQRLRAGAGESREQPLIDPVQMTDAEQAAMVEAGAGTGTVAIEVSHEEDAVDRDDADGDEVHEAAGAEQGGRVAAAISTTML